MIGCDIIEIERIRQSYAKYGRSLLDRILSISEQEIFFQRNESINFLAGRFAGKESVAKAFRTGIGEHISFVDIEILPDSAGAPTVSIKGTPAPEIEISISHCKEYAIAMATK
ncbi:MAG: holo-ACP synthase [Deferribacteraceae bacterium]|jgi:holo-[acyl-carrier protein] synthase|nr:holo-ACP synthase [Deferribacteraceae bacterium]